ncbi:efflux RND transporter periplasmic adaptor subunit [Vibrio intestinalis]|uniref:efflux RND transporter periplasmic adaptor subunit n=1 Tax=Vibrio intestinalis TaxID=2933291 RepID=UPI0024319F16|nr:efflux RND transporter periplasmic adaptor subunit [Vibrio intestinalis]
MRMKYTSVALAVVALAGCKAEMAHREKSPLVVDTYKVEAPITSQYRVINGQAMPAELTPLAFRTDGEISAILVQEGDRVNKGQVIALLDDTKAKQNVFDAQARYELALKQYQRGQELHKKNMVSKAELDQLAASFKLTRAQLGAAKAQVTYTRLRAPFAGKISDVDKKKYENISPGETVVSLYKDDKVYVKVSVSDSVLAMIEPGMNHRQYQPQASFSGHDQSYTLSYLEHTSELHPQSQSYEFWLTMPQVEPQILPGTSVKVSVDLLAAGIGPQHGYQLPMTAIDTGSQVNQFFVWKLEDENAHRYPIKIEQINGTGAIATSGIESGDIIINSNLRKLREGMEIKGAQL